MDKTAIKNYAVSARRKLIEAVTLKGKELLRGGEFFSVQQKTAQAQLMKADFNQVVENVAYTWFNRLIALRFMEINGYLPSGIRILSSVEPSRLEPDALRNVDKLDHVNQAKVSYILSDNPDINTSERLYKYILTSQCNALAEILPGTFQKIDDYTELLLPDALYKKGGIVYDLTNAVKEEDFTDGVQIIGWLYQFYISEKKYEVFAGFKKNIKISRDTIPAATQLFTPEWIVKYMVENSLGRLWLENNPDDELRKKWRYYIDEAQQEREVAEQIRFMRSENPVKSPEDIRLIDPCMGSGHVLVYAFDVLNQIYESAGYSEREIPNLILKHNIYGLDIDDRAGQLAYFALMMKARSYNRRFFRQEDVPQPMIYSAKNDGELMEYGSLVKVDDLGEKPEPPEELSLFDFDHKQKVNSWNFRSLLAGKYDVVVTNPPYMSPTPSQTDWVKKHYPNSKSDLCVVFIERNFDLLKQNGFLSMITMHSWMFTSTYENFREQLIASKTFVNMVHLGAKAFEEIGGEVVQTTAFAMNKLNVPGYSATYVRLVDFNRQQAKEDAFLKNKNRYTSKKANFVKIAGTPIAYWASENIFSAFTSKISFGDIVKFCVGISTANNDRFIRYWFEPQEKDFARPVKNKNDIQRNQKWFPFNNGGGTRRWYGNNFLVINWQDDGSEIKATGRASIRNKDYYFKSGYTWSDISTGRIGMRYYECGHIFSTAGLGLFGEKNVEFVVAFLNSVASTVLLDILCPSLHFNIGDLAKIPFIEAIEYNFRIKTLLQENIDISRADWDSFETSWDFSQHPLLYIKSGALWGDRTIEEYEDTFVMKNSFSGWERLCQNRFDTLKSNEEELNRIFIDIYGLQDELTPEVDDKDVIVRKADLVRDIRSFISYAIGCMFGRYSLDEPGLVFAGGIFDKSRYTAFKTVEANIIPINHAEYFDDDIVVRFVEFVSAVYGEGTLGENLNFITDALYPNANGTAHEKLRRYFLNDFYKDHVKIYQKRPIYWLFDSGKKDGFKALFYLHRYDKFTVARARTDYMHPLQRKYDGEIKRLEILSAETTDTREKNEYRKESEMLRAKMDECRIYDQIMAHIAHQQIALDLDDGVKVNYEKFQGVEVPKDDGEIVKMDLLGKI